MVSGRSRHALWYGVSYRWESFPYANWGPFLFSVGSKIVNDRWNPPNRFPIFYSGLDSHAALDELLFHFRSYGFSIVWAMPRVAGFSERRSRSGTSESP
jgi:hypothetical protein